MHDNSHTILVKEILLALGREWEVCRAWQNDTGKAKSFDGQRVISFGLIGSSDIFVLMRYGIMVFLECKTGRGRQSAEQICFEKMVKSLEGNYHVVRNKNEAIDIVKKTANRIDRLFTQQH